MTFISKSKYLAGLQCSKLLWYYYNAKEEIPPPDPATQAVFDQGHEVGELAKSLFPGGIEVARGIVDFEQVLPLSLEAIRLRKPLFEPAFRYKNAFARADVLNPVGGARWDIIEVKSSTEVKEINLHDMALQRYTYEGAGLKIGKCVLMYVNNSYVRRGPVEPEKLFTREDVTTRVSALMPQVESNLDSMGNVIRLKKHPDVPIGPQCDDPYTCPLHGLCWKFLPEDNVFTLNRLGEKAFVLLGRGVMKIADIPEDYKLTVNQRIQRESVRHRRTMIDGRAIAAFLKSLAYPLYFLDFETFGTAIPLFDGIWPYQQIPFQFSLHIVRAEGAGAEHHSFLAEGDADPRSELLAGLRKLLGTRGSIVCYNASFERGRIEESCEAFPEFAAWWELTSPRIVDLYAPFRSFHYYHPDQEGSASMKAVLPALTGKGYDEMPIADGGTASREYLRVTFCRVTPAERRKVRSRLEAYCGLDTSGMVDIVTALRDIVGARQSS